MNAFLNAGTGGVNDIGCEFCRHAGAMFVQSGVLIVVLLSVDLLLRRHLRAAVRYWIWMLVIVKLLLPPTLSLPTGVGHWLGRYAAPPAPAARQVLGTAGPQETFGQPMPPDMAGRTSVSPRPRPDAEVGAAMAGTVPRPRERLTWQGGAVLLWAVGVLGFIGLVLRRVFFVKRLVVQGRPAQGEPVDLLEECRRRMNIRLPVRMKLLPGAFSPAVCGLRRPTILLPQMLLTRLAPDNLRAVLIHELAHVKRADLWVNCLQTILQILYFYNPLVWLANAIVRRVREQAVDEMSLVALGAEARSYGDTLIDVAEMAFWRANPALGLVGVAESKKSLEGRIKHMISRPIPRNAKVGATGALAIVAVGALLLPMAAARTNSERAKFMAHLPGGATVELVGVCNWPASGPVSWNADGSKKEQPLQARKGNLHPGPSDYGFLFKVSGTDDIDLTWDTIAGSESGEGSCDVVDAQGNRLEGHNATVASFQEVPAQTTLRMGLASGPWTTISTHDGRGMSQGHRTGVLWSQPFEDAAGVYVVASAKLNGERKERIAALDTGGTLHVAPWNGSVSFGDMGQLTARFPGLKANQIKELQYQVRTCQSIEFQNVSLRPGRSTGVRVRIADEPAEGSFRTYEVNRRVADFPATEDFSTPEAAYATINRVDRDDPAAWQRASVARLAQRFAQQGPARQGGGNPEWMKVLLQAHIREVVIWNLTRAIVIAELPGSMSGRKVAQPIDVRSLQLENGRWLNTGNSRFDSVEEAKTQFLGRMERETTRPEALQDPLRHASKIKAAAAQLFERLRTADYADILSHYRDGKFDSEGWEKFPTRGLYQVRTDYPSFALWCCAHFKDNPIVDVQLGDVFIGDALIIDKTGWPTVPYKLTLKDGTTLAGSLPFNYETNQGRGHWHGMEGLDWHLWSHR